MDSSMNPFQNLRIGEMYKSRSIYNFDCIFVGFSSLSRAEYIEKRNTLRDISTLYEPTFSSSSNGVLFECINGNGYLYIPCEVAQQLTLVIDPDFSALKRQIETWLRQNGATQRFDLLLTFRRMFRDDYHPLSSNMS